MVNRKEMRAEFLKLYLIILLCSSSFLVKAQSIEAIKNAYYQSGQQVVLAKNTGQLIPIKELDICKPAYITASFNSSGLLPSLEHYLYTPAINLRAIEYHTFDKNINLLFLDIDLEKTTKNELIILSALLHKVTKRYIVIFSHTALGSIPDRLFENAHAILFTWGDSPYLHDHIAQKIYGGEGSTAQLPFKINSSFPQGSGLMTLSLNRLIYGPAELVNISSSSFEYALQLEVEDAIRNQVFPGANLLVAKNGVVIYHRAFGKKQYDAPAPVEKNHLYDLASITKIFAATLGGMYYHSQGLFDPDKSLSHYWPFLKKSNKANLIWSDVLAHKSRLPATITYYRNMLHATRRFKRGTIHSKISTTYPHQINDSLFARKNIPTKLLTEIKRIPLLPKAGYVYSDLSMILLGKTIEHMSGQTLADFTRDKFYKKLGASHSTFLPSQLFTKDMIIPTERDSVFRQELVHGYVHDENASLLGGISGHAGLFSNANDMAKIAQMLLNNGSYGGIEFLKPSTVELFTKYQFPELDNRRGLGFDKPLLKYDVNLAHTARDASVASYGHSGFTGTFIWIDPKYNLTYILLTNRVYPTRRNNKISQYSIRPCIQQTIYDHILNANN